LTSKIYSCEYIFCEEKTDVIAYHLEGLHVPPVVCVPQFEEHCFKER